VEVGDRILLNFFLFVPLRGVDEANGAPDVPLREVWFDKLLMSKLSVSSK
jgi:hypothetical protein